MVKILVGKKGTGKTKMLIEMVNETAVNSKGSVVCIEKGNSLTFDIKPIVRLVSTDEYEIDKYNSLYGFICGMMAANYDCNEFFLDSITRMCGGTFEDVVVFLEHIEKVTEENNVNLTLTLSAAYEEIPEVLKKYVINV